MNTIPAVHDPAAIARRMPFTPFVERQTPRDVRSGSSAEIHPKRTIGPTCG